VEGAYCTSESVLNDFFGIEPIIDNKAYPFICPEESVVGNADDVEKFLRNIDPARQSEESEPV
jgi:hypothetical protein